MLGQCDQTGAQPNHDDDTGEQHDDDRQRINHFHDDHAGDGIDEQFILSARGSRRIARLPLTASAKKGRPSRPPPSADRVGYRSRQPLKPLCRR